MKSIFYAILGFIGLVLLTIFCFSSIFFVAALSKYIENGNVDQMLPDTISEIRLLIDGTEKVRHLSQHSGLGVLDQRVEVKGVTFQ